VHILDAWKKEAKRVFELFKTKQNDYGPQNIAQMGELGVATRANDKVQRLLTLLSGDEGTKRYHETIEDSWMDLADYGIIGLLVHTGQWPPVEAPRRHPANQSLWDENKELKRRLEQLEDLAMEEKFLITRGKMLAIARGEWPNQ